MIPDMTLLRPARYNSSFMSSANPRDNTGLTIAPETANAEKVFVSWSGGKDSCYACYKAMQSGLDVRYLASMLTRNTGRLFPHYVTAEVLRAQAAAIGIPLFEQWLEVPETVTQNVRFVDYDIKYVEMLHTLKALGITGGVFGDVSIGNQFAQAHWTASRIFAGRWV